MRGTESSAGEAQRRVVKWLTVGKFITQALGRQDINVDAASPPAAGHRPLVATSIFDAPHSM